MAMVWVGPPLAVRAPSLGSTNDLSVPIRITEQLLVSRIRLWPADPGPPQQSRPKVAVLLARIVEFRVMWESPRTTPLDRLAVAPMDAEVLQETDEFIGKLGLGAEQT